LQLAEQCRLALDAPIQAYLPQLALDTPVTIRRILNHSSGIADYGGLASYSQALKADPRRPWTREEFLAATLPGGLMFEPGQGWAYSNIGYLLLRMLIETVTGAPLREVFSTSLFMPLFRDKMSVAQSLDDATRLTPGYSAFFRPDASLEDIRLFYHPGWVSHGVVISSAGDLAAVTDAIFAGSLISPLSLAAMWQALPVPVKNHAYFQQPAYGLGLMVDLDSRYGVIGGHGGGGPGYSTGVIHIPEVRGRRITCAALANRDQGDIGLQIAFATAMQVADMLERGQHFLETRFRRQG
jgi:D-alanyl-D-alanine carboxypeptidase